MNRKTAFRLLLSVFLNAGTQLSAQDSPPPLSADEGAELRSKFAARGLPTSLQELDDWYRRVPEGKNAADWFEEASMRLVHAQGERQRQLPVVGRKDVLEIGDALDDETARLARAFLNENRTALKYAREGAVFEESRYPIDLKLGYEVPLPHLAPLRDLARTLYLESLVLTHDGHTEGAVDSVRVMYAIARSLESEPVLASQTVRIAIESMTTSMFSKNLSARPFSPAELDEVSRLSKSDVGLNSCYRAFVADALTATFQPQGLEGSHHQVGDAGFLATYL